MKLPFGVIDSDGHINEPEDELRTYIEGPYGEIKNKIHRYTPNADGVITPISSRPSPFQSPTTGVSPACPKVVVKSATPSKS